MSDNVKFDQVILGASPTLTHALEHGKMIAANKVRIVAVQLDMAGEACAYIVVPSEHKCPCCSQMVTAASD